MKILKGLLMIITAPVILVLTLFVWLCTGLIYISGLVLGLLSMVIALLGVAVLITYSPQISTQIFCSILLHLLMDQLQFLCGYPKQHRNIPLTLCHSYRSGSRFFEAAGLWAGSSCLSLSRTEGRDGCSFSP